MTSDNPIVFVVDDDYRVREALSSLIASVGLHVTAYGSAAEFLAAEKPDAPACLVLDLQLPGASGLDLQRELANGSGPPIIFITGHGDIPSSVRAMKAGAIEFLPKPFGDEDLLKAIDAAICGCRTGEQADGRGTWHQRDHHWSSSRPDHAQDGRRLAGGTRPHGGQTSHCTG